MYQQSQQLYELRHHKVLSQSLFLTALMMVPTVLGVYLGYGSKFSMWGMIAIVLVLFASLIGASITASSGNGLALPLVGVFSVTMGLMISVAITAVMKTPNGAQIIMGAVAAAGVTFGVAGVIGATTKKDLSGMGNILCIALIAMIVVGLINIFLGSSIISLLLSCIGVVVFTLFTVYDINRIVTGGETNPIMAAIGLYLNIINLFMDFLKIFAALDD